MKNSDRCPTCKQLIKKQRSVEISTRFHGWVTWMAKELTMDRDKVYFLVLLKAIEIECDGGSPYPYSIVARKIISPITGDLIWHDLPEPLRTEGRTNKQMMTACTACELWWAEYGNGLPLPEKPIGENE